MIRLAILSVPVERGPESTPLGAACVAAAIRAEPGLAGRVEAFVHEGSPGADPEELARSALATGAGSFGLSVYSWNRRSMAGVARVLRRERPEAPLFAGGPEVSADPDGFLREAPLDFAVVGEGERAACRALEAILRAPGTGAPDASAPATGEPGAGAFEAALRRIPGLRFPGDRGPVLGSPPEEAAALASPWAGTLDPAGAEGLLWELARGCPFRCAYCYESKGTSGVRAFPMDRVESELERFVRAGAGRIFVLDPTFNADAERAAALLDLFRERAPGIWWKFEVRAEFLNRDLVAKFAALDCSLQIGLQSANPAALALIGRGLDRKAFALRAAALDRAGVAFGLDLIYGLPGDGPADFRASLDFALGLGPNHLDIFPLALLPGTELRDRAGELGLEYDSEPPYLVRATPSMTRGELEAAAGLAAACDRFYTRGRAVAWFRAVARPLGLGPAAFLERYGAWLEGRGGKGRSGSGGAGREPTERGRAGAGRTGGGSEAALIEAEQLAFLEGEYRAAGLAELLPALRDLVRFNGAWGRALAEGGRSLIDLSYGLEDIAGPAALDLARFARSAARKKGRIAVGPGPEGGVTVELLGGPGARGPGSRGPSDRRRPTGGRPGPGGRRRDQPR